MNVCILSIFFLVYTYLPTIEECGWFNFECMYIYIQTKRKKWWPISMMTVMLVLVFPSTLCLVQWWRCCCRVGILMARLTSFFGEEIKTAFDFYLLHGGWILKHGWFKVVYPYLSSEDNKEMVLSSEGKIK